MKLGLMILIPVFLSCESNHIGIEYELESNLNTHFIEFTLPAANIYLDSLRTDGENRILVGSYNDPLTGNVTAEGYFQFFYEKGPLPRKRQTSSEPNPKDTLQLDSIVVIFETNSAIPQGRAFLQEFTLHELQGTLKGAVVYLSHLQQTLSSQMGSYSKTTNSLLDTIYRIKLEDTYANSFFKLISDIAGDSTKTVGSSLFKSLGVIPSISSEGIASLDFNSDTTKLILYSSPISASSKDITYLTYFKSNRSSENYTYLKRNRSGSSFDGIVENKDFDLASGKTLIDPISGISTTFSIRELESFFMENENIIINNATIEFDFESESDRDTLLNFINFFRKRDNSIFGPAIAINPFEGIVMADRAYINSQISSPATSFLDDSKNSLLISATLFFQQLYSQTKKTDSLSFTIPLTTKNKSIEELVLISPINVTLNRTFFKKDGIKLKIYYTEADQ